MSTVSICSAIIHLWHLQWLNCSKCTCCRSRPLRLATTGSQISSWDHNTFPNILKPLKQPIYYIIALELNNWIILDSRYFKMGFAHRSRRRQHRKIGVTLQRLKDWNSISVCVDQCHLHIRSRLLVKKPHSGEWYQECTKAKCGEKSNMVYGYGLHTRKLMGNSTRRDTQEWFTAVDKIACTNMNPAYPLYKYKSLRCVTRFMAQVIVHSITHLPSGSPFQSFRFVWIDFTLPRDLLEQLLLPQPSGCEDVLQGSAVLSQSSWTRLIKPLPSCWFFLKIGDRPNRNQEHARSAPRVWNSKWLTLMLDVPNIHGYIWIHLDQVVNTSSCIAHRLNSSDGGWSAYPL